MTDPFEDPVTVRAMPVVLRISVGAKYGAQHSQDWTALAHHIPGLRVVYPVTPYDAKGMMNAALAGGNLLLIALDAGPEFNLRLHQTVVVHARAAAGAEKIDVRTDGRPIARVADNSWSLGQ